MIIPENYCHKNIVDTIIDIEKLAIEEEGRKEGRKEGRNFILEESDNLYCWKSFRVSSPGCAPNSLLSICSQIRYCSRASARRPAWSR